MCIDLPSAREFHIGFHPKQVHTMSGCLKLVHIIICDIKYEYTECKKIDKCLQ